MNKTPIEIEPEEKVICSECISDSYLKSFPAKGEFGICSYCKRKAPTILLLNIIELIENGILSVYYRTPDDPGDDYNPYETWYRDGEYIEDVIQEEVGVEPEIAHDIQYLLSERHYKYDSDGIMEEHEFETGSMYESKTLDDSEFFIKWNRFKELSLQNSTSAIAERQTILSEFFAGLNELKNNKEQLSIVEIGPDTDITKLYRARTFTNTQNLLKALKSPDKELGTPAPEHVAAGRMNQAFKPVFYGAELPRTTIREVRPPVGSKVAVACFEIVRKLKILDMSVMDGLYHGGSIFDPDTLARRVQATFLRKFSELIAIPVMPGEEELEYAPTQQVAIFLTEKLNLDGIRFPSVQSGGNEMNITLFPHASFVEQIIFPDGSEVYSREEYDDGNYYDPYSVRINLPQGGKITNRSNPDGITSLRIDTKSIEIHQVKMSNFDCKTSYMQWDEVSPETFVEIDIERLFGLQ